MSFITLVAVIFVVAICDGYVNVARGKPARQIDTYTGEGVTTAGCAVDGETEMSTYGCTHTTSSQDTWWVVDFLKDYLIHAVNISNRKTRPDRLQQFTVQISTSNPMKHNGFPRSLPGEMCFYRAAQIAAGASEIIPCSKPVVGRYLTVYKAGNSHLTICELEAFATNVSQQITRLRAIPNKRLTAKPFFTFKDVRSSLECMSLCLRMRNGSATAVQRHNTDGLCECIQVSDFDSLQPSTNTSTGWMLFVSNFN